jgi:hypothetical protein
MSRYINYTLNFTSSGQLQTTNLSAGTLNVSGGLTTGSILSTGLTTGNINFTGSLFQNGLAYLGSQWTTTSGNVSYTSGSVVSTNFVSTNITVNSLLVSGGNLIVSNGNLNVSGTTNSVSVSSGNVYSTNVSSGTLNASTGITSATLLVTGMITAGSVQASSSTIPNVVFTNITTGGFKSTSFGNLSYNSNTIGNIFTTGGSVGIGSINPRAILEITQTGSTTNSMIYSGLQDGGVNNLIFMHHGNSTLWRKVMVSSQATGMGHGRAHWGVLSNLASNGTDATWSDLRIFVNGLTGNVGINTSTTNNTLDVSGTLNVSTSITTGTINATTSTIPNVVHTNISTGTINATTGITSATLLVTGMISSSSLQATSSTITNLVTTNISASTLRGIDLFLSGTLTTVNITTQNLLVSSGYLIANSSTLGSLLISGGNLNMSGGSLNISGGSVNISGGALNVSGNISSANVVSALAFTGGSLQISGTISTGTLKISNTLDAQFNSNTLGNLFTTGGNVGIGTTSPGETLSVNGPIRTIGSTGILNFYNAEQTTRFGYLYHDGTTIELNNQQAGGMFFSTNNSEKMRILSGGNVGIGTTSPTQLLHIQKSGSDNYIKVDAGGINSNWCGIMLSEHNINFGWSLRHNTQTDLLHISYQDSTPAFTDLVTFDRSNNRVGISTTSPSGMLHLNNVALFTSVGNLTCTGDVVSFGNLSDVRLKKNIQTFDTQKSIDIVKNMRAVTFNWKEDIFNENKRNTGDIGFIAQELEELIPEAVSEYTEIKTGKTYKNIKYERIIPHLLSTIQYLVNEVEQLKLKS